MSGAPRLQALGIASASLLHELRQPIFAIKALAQVARTEAGASARLDQILAQVEHVEALLELYGATGSRPGVLVVFDLAAEVRAAIALLATRIEGLGVALRLDLPPGALRVRGRPLAARQVVVNLLQNALDAVRDAPSREVVIGATRAGDAVRLWVHDNGDGVDPAVAATLFEPFVTTRDEGLGLGLFLARSVVREAEGDLRMEPAEVGARFVLSWPVAA